MTKEEIRQEAVERVNICTPYHTGSFIQGYIAGAEPRENKIADIKANCDLAIEGRDTKIKELENQVKDLEWQLQEVVKDNDNYQAENKKLEQQIEKMKNYLNCENYGKCGNSMGCPCDKWECIEK